jgi:DNA-binding MarR family transcriptional regulator
MTGRYAARTVADDPTKEFQPVFWATKRVMANASASAFARHGVHEGQQYILMCLWEEDGLTPGDVAKRLGLATPTVTRATARMEAAGLLRREPHEVDRRRVRLLLTERGRALEGAIGKEMDELSERALASLDPAERQALVRALSSVHRNLVGAAEAAAAGHEGDPSPAGPPPTG